MSSCGESIEHYLYSQEKIKKNMSKLKDKCPDKVLNFILSKESKTTINRLKDCTWSDNSDKKQIFRLLKKTCDDL
jgi:hypothetical protein